LQNVQACEHPDASRRTASSLAIGKPTESDKKLSRDGAEY
jgi:hypothetical protein